MYYYPVITLIVKVVYYSFYANYNYQYLVLQSSTDQLFKLYNFTTLVLNNLSYIRKNQKRHFLKRRYIMQLITLTKYANKTQFFFYANVKIWASYTVFGTIITKLKHTNFLSVRLMMLSTYHLQETRLSRHRRWIAHYTSRTVIDVSNKGNRFADRLSHNAHRD